MNRRTLDELMVEALQVQDACNLSGVVHSFSRALTELRENGINDTDALNNHPISVLYSDKIASLTQSGDFYTVNKACDMAHEAEVRLR